MARAASAEMTELERRPPPTARLFFALWPDEVMQAALAAAVTAATGTLCKVDGSAIGRPVPARNFHLTLAFLGAVPVSRFEALSAVAAQCAQAFASLTSAASGGSAAPVIFTLDTLEHWRKPQILCATATRTPASALALAESLKRALIDQSFTPDPKPFLPHVTLARKVRSPIKSLGMTPVLWRFNHFALVQSQTDSRGSAYTLIASYPLN